jgi:hypothetical protein
MKNILKISALLLIIYFTRNYMIEHNLTLIEMFTTFPEKENTPQINHTPKQIPKEENPTHQPKDIIFIKALGNVEYNDLTDAKNIIEETYQFNCIIISEREPITEDLYIREQGI